MIHFFKEVRVLREEGKIHSKLIFRVRMLFVIALILGGIVGYQLFLGANPWVVLMLAVIGFVLGLYVFARMSVVNWNEEREILETGRMDKVGYITLALYIAVEIGLRTFLNDFYPASATAFLLSGVFGALFGRAVGTVIEIHNVYRSIHAK